MGGTLRTLPAAAAALALAAAGCTVQDAKAPALAGPSSFALTVLLSADRPVLERGSSTTIRIRTLDAYSQPVSVALRAELSAEHVLFDYGRLSSRDVTTGSDGTATLTYFAPPPVAPASDSGQDIVTVRVTPLVGGDARGLQARQLDIRLVPPGTIIPVFQLQASFTVTPSSPQAFAPVIFDASNTQWRGASCLDQCTYAWTFDDGTGGNGRVVTKSFRSAGTFVVRLLVTDPFGTTAQALQSVTVTPSTALTASLQFSPSQPRTGLQVLFDARGSTGPDPIVEYRYSFGDPCRPGEVVTSDPTATHIYTMAGTFTARLTIRDLVGRTATTTISVAVTGTETGCPP